jgi:hypothetical protein
MLYYLYPSRTYYITNWYYYNPSRVFVGDEDDEE